MNKYWLLTLQIAYSINLIQTCVVSSFQSFFLERTEEKGYSRMKSLGLAIFVSCCLVTFAEKVRYDQYRIYSVQIESESQLKVLQKLENDRNGISFMNPPIEVLQKVDILVPPHKFAEISDIFELYDFTHSIKVENLQK